MKTILMFPKKGDPPPDQPGYQRVPGHPYVFKMIWISCSARQDIKACDGCPQSYTIHKCTFYDKEVDQNVCRQCGGIESATERESKNAGGN